MLTSQKSSLVATCNYLHVEKTALYSCFMCLIMIVYLGGPEYLQDSEFSPTGAVLFHSFENILENGYSLQCLSIKRLCVTLVLVVFHSQNSIGVRPAQHCWPHTTFNTFEISFDSSKDTSWAAATRRQQSYFMLTAVKQNFERTVQFYSTSLCR